MKLWEAKKFDRLDTCCLCGKNKEQVSKMIVGLHGATCGDCIALSIDILGHENACHRLHLAGVGDLANEVLYSNQMLPQAGLVTMHSGNASGYDPDQDLVLIKPSGFDYEAIGLDCLVPIECSSGDPHPATSNQHGLRPSVDLPHHLFLYRHLPGVRGVVHTHSNYATAFAAVGHAIPCVLTAIADEFGGEIPCAPYVDNEGDNIGRTILEHKANRAPAILLANHGVFAWGDSPRAALKAAIMVEDVARTVFLAIQLGDPNPLPSEEIEKWWDRYQNRYGQTM